jgi:hypothetical protein
MLETAGHRNGALVLASGTQPPAPPPVYPEAFARLRDKASSELADVHVKQTADAALEAVDDCEAARVLFTELAHVGAGERCEILTTKMPAAIVECDCERAPELTSLVQKLTAVDAPVLEADAIVLDRAAAIAVDPAQTWGDFIAKRTTGFDRLWFTTR